MPQGQTKYLRPTFTNTEPLGNIKLLDNRVGNWPIDGDGQPCDNGVTNTHSTPDTHRNLPSYTNYTPHAHKHIHPYSTANIIHIANTNTFHTTHTFSIEYPNPHTSPHTN